MQDASVTLLSQDATASPGHPRAPTTAIGSGSNGSDIMMHIFLFMFMELKCFTILLA